MRRRLDGDREQVKALFGGYDRGYDTDFDLIDRALSVAAEAIRLVGTAPVPEGLAKAIALGTVPPSGPHAIGLRILDAIQRWEQAEQELTTWIPPEDLHEAQELVHLRQRLDGDREQVKALLGGYDRGYDTDFDLIDRALSVAAEAIRLVGTAPVLEGLAKAIALGTVPPSGLHAIGLRILDAIQRWEQAEQELTTWIPPEDLHEAQELVHLRQRLDGDREQVKALLGGYDRGYDTDFDLIDRALSVAAEAIRLVGTAPVPEGLAKAIALGTVPPSDLLETGKHVLDVLQKWEQAAQELDPFIPFDRLPTTGLPIMQSLLTDLGKWVESLKPALGELSDLLGQILPHCWNNRPDTLLSLLADLESNDKLNVIESQINVESDRLKQKFGAHYYGLDTDWSNILAALKWTEKMQQLFNAHPSYKHFYEVTQSLAVPHCLTPAPIPISERFIHLAAQGGSRIPSMEELTSAYQRTVELFQELEKRFDMPGPTYCGKPFKKLTLAELYDRARTLMERIDDLQAWTDFKRLQKQVPEAGLGDFLTQVQKDPPPAPQLVQVFRKSVYQAWIDNVFERDHRLKSFRGQDHERCIREFREVDRKLVLLSAQQIIKQCNDRRPQSVFLHTQDSEISTLLREAAKSRRHLPMRSLFERIPNLLLRLKPCLLMSPLSVSQFLHPERIRFDLIIFDEASQIFTEDAVGAIYRGSQLIVAGDSKQLPPTDFFKSLDNDGDDTYDEITDDPTSADFNSVLDECATILQSIPAPFLKWHYRSRHESLIAFSNYRFYDRRLITFPSSQHEHETLGVKFVYVPDGVYDRGGKRNNLREAEVVADLVFDHFIHYPQKSLGVIAFSQTQMIAIEDEIDRRWRAHPQKETFDRFFKEDRLEGFFVKNLENVQGDERDVVIFSVGYGYDQHRRMTMNFGPLNKLGGERRLNVAVTRAREKVILVSSIKASNIPILGTTQAAAGVLNLYHYLDYAERGELEPLDPPPGEFESPLEEAVASEIRRMGYHVVPQVGCSGYRIDIGVVDPAEPGRFLLGIECDGATYHSAATARDRDRLRQQILENLGWHIHRVWAPDWIYKRETEIRRIKQAIEEARQGRSNPPSNPGEQGDQFTHVSVPPLEAGKPIPETKPYRKIEHIASEEIQNAMILIIRHIVGIGIESLIVETARLFGFSRTGNKIRDRMLKECRDLQKKGIIIENGDSVTLRANGP